MELHKDAKIQAVKVFNNIEQRCITKHNGIYSYNNFIYLAQRTPSYITCPKHGDFLQNLANHLNGKGCSLCARERIGASQVLSNEQFKTRSSIIHKGIYDYSKVVYKNYYTPVTIICHTHGDFIQKPSEHLAGSGCQTCGEITKRKKYLSIPTRLYYIKITTPLGNILYKLGITTKSVSERYYNEAKSGCTIELLKEYVFSTGYLAYEEEQRLLKRYKNFKYLGPNVLIKGGNSELFTEDILGYDKIK